MGVKQFNAQYSLVEDRIVFSFNTQESQLYSFLLTRAMTQSFFDQCDLYLSQSLIAVHCERTSKIISEFQKNELKKHLDFKDTFQGGQTFPIGREPILVSIVRIELEDNHLRISLTLVNNQVVAFGLPSLQLQALTLLLEKLAYQANWQICEVPLNATNDQIMSISNTSDSLH